MGAPEEAQGTAPRRRQTDMQQTRVLVVDDDPAILAILSETLEEYGFEVLRAATGLEAVTLAWQTEVDAIVLDVMLPGMSGVKVVAALKGDPSTADVPILLLTASIDGAADGLAAGAESYLRKPFDSPDLHKRLLALLAQRPRPAADGSAEKGQ